MGDSLFKKARELNCTVDGKEFNSKHWQLSRRKKYLRAVLTTGTV